MNNLIPYISAGLIGAMLLLGGFFAGKKNATPEIITIPGETITETIIQTETTPVDTQALAESIEQKLGGNYEEVIDYIRELEADIQALSTVTASSQGSSEVIQVVSEECDITSVDEELTLAFEDDGKDVYVPVAHITLTEEGILSYEVYPLSFNFDSIITRLSNGAPSLIAQLTIDSQGSTYPVPITGNTSYDLDRTVKIPRRNFTFVDPSISLNLDFMGGRPGFNGGASAAIHLSSLETRGDLTWKFIGAGIGYGTQQSPYLVVSPFSYNVGEPLPFFRDLWLQPSFAYSFDADWYLGISIGTNL